MDFQLSPEEEAFRLEVRAFLDEHMPEGAERTPELMANWYEQVRARRWVGFNWPQEFGGGNGDVIRQFILKEEMSARRAPALGTDFMGLTWVGPAIIAHGSEEQKAKHLKKIQEKRHPAAIGTLIAYLSSPMMEEKMPKQQTASIQEVQENGDHCVGIHELIDWQIIQYRQEVDAHRLDLSKVEGRCVAWQEAEKDFSRSDQASLSDKSRVEYCGQVCPFSSNCLIAMRFLNRKRTEPLHRVG